MLFVQTKVFSAELPSIFFNFHIQSRNQSNDQKNIVFVTAIYDSTFIEIIDDHADGDNDDSYKGYLMAGEVYIIDIEDNAINDNAPYFSEGKQIDDGDFLIILASKLVYTSGSNEPQWQLNSSPSIDRSSNGNQFIYHADSISKNAGNLNFVVFEEQTEIIVRDITILKSATKYLNVLQLLHDSNLIHQTVDAGIYVFPVHSLEKNSFEVGHTYLIESNKTIDIQRELDLTSWNSEKSLVFQTQAKPLFYLTLPKEKRNEQQFRIISWHAANSITIEQFCSGTWIMIQHWELEKMDHIEWTYKPLEANSSPVFRVRCSNENSITLFAQRSFETSVDYNSSKSIAAVPIDED